MKRMIALLLAFAVSVSLVGCGKVMCSAEGCKNAVSKDAEGVTSYCDKHLAKMVYDSLKVAYSVSERMGNDIIAAWEVGIYQKKDFQSHDNDKVSKLATKLSLSKHDVLVGTAAAYKLMFKGVLWEDMTEEEKETAISTEDGVSDGDMALTMMAFGNLFEFCVNSVIAGYTHNGSVERAESMLTMAKDYIKILGDVYPDYIHYADLLDYYTAVSSYFDFCQNPTGNLEQASNSNIEYQNDAKDYVNKLELVFGD